ncbi:MAG: hypothetical protein IKR83_02315 [Bacteroidales bacterium]|nr:hypothetical protein [Bacteroidales bacterium]
MKKAFIKATFIALIGVAASGCQKEATPETIGNLTVSENVRTVCYTVDGRIHWATFHDDASWDEFVRVLFTMAKEGHQVSFIITSSATHSSQTKDVVTYTTDDENDAKKWAKKMADEGYNVYIEFDAETGIWTCTATKP